MTEPERKSTNDPTAAGSPKPGPDGGAPDEGALDTAALDQVVGGRMIGDTQPFEVFHPHQPLSWSAVLTDPTMSVPHTPALGEFIARALQAEPSHDEPKPDGKPTVFANW